MKTAFLDLGKQPVANGFLKNIEEDEFFYDLQVSFDTENHLVSIVNVVEKERLFNENYVYHSSLSRTMREHFRDAAFTLARTLPGRVLEIGSNDGVFLQHWPKGSTVSVEPCSNFAAVTNEMGYHTLPKFWDQAAADWVLEGGKVGLVFSANCFCHIEDLDDAFEQVRRVLSSRGLLVIEDPSLLQMLKRNSFDQFYDEHVHMFSLVALKAVLARHDLVIVDVEPLTVHGGSNRIVIGHAGSHVSESANVVFGEKDEVDYGLKDLDTYFQFAKDVERSKMLLVNELNRLKRTGKKVCGYGATAKSTTLFNYAKIGPALIEFVTDSTPDKQGTFTPGMHIPVVPRDERFTTIDVAFLGAWNFEGEIREKEREFIHRGGRFLTHVPFVRYTS